MSTISSQLTLQGDAKLFELMQVQDASSESEVPPSFPRDLPEELRSVLESHGAVFGLPSGLITASTFCQIQSLSI